MTKLAYFNGQYLPLEEVTISPFDRGFLFAESIYEVISFYERRPLAFSEHYQRLLRSAQGIGLECPLSLSEFEGLADKLISSLNTNDALLYIQITGGADIKRSHIAPLNLEPTVFAYPIAFHEKSSEALATSAKAKTLNDVRWHRCDIKSTALLGNVHGLNQSIRADAALTEVIFVRDGNIQEGSCSNVFMEKDGTLFTPKLTEFVLPGITRQILIRLANELNIPLQECDVSLNALEQADNVWITSTTKEITPLSHLNDRLVGNGQPSKLWHKIIDAYKKHIHSSAAVSALD